MEISTLLSIAAVIISILALYLSYLSHKSIVNTNIENQLTIKAQECNKYVNPLTLGPPDKTEHISAVLTNIIYSKKILKMFYKNHGLSLFSCDEYDFIRFLYFQLHTSNIELVKNELPANIDNNLRHIIELQHRECFIFLERIIAENPSQPAS